MSRGIICPECHGRTRVVDSRGRDGFIYRRRSCQACGQRFSTCERIVGTRIPDDCVSRDLVAAAVETLIQDLELADRLGLVTRPDA